MAWVRIAGIIVGLVAIIISVIIIISLRKKIGEAIDIPDNSTKVINISRGKFTDGYCFGLLIKDKPNRNGTSFIEYYPTDYEQGENKPKPKKQSLIVKNEFIKRIPVGDISSRRNIMFLLPRSALDLPESLRDSLLGKWMTTEGQKAFMLNAIGPMIPSGDEAISEVIRHNARGQISRDYLKKINELCDDIEKISTGRNIGGGENRKV